MTEVRCDRMDAPARHPDTGFPRGTRSRPVETATLVDIPRGAGAPSDELPSTARVVTTLTGATTAALEVDHDVVGTEHPLTLLRVSMATH
jgi:hypothetical protein